MNQFQSIREGYEQIGHEQYYQEYGSNYKNPHEDKIKQVLLMGLTKWKPKLIKVLDLACGSGEITLILKSLGVKNIVAIDPYTMEAFKKRTGEECLPISFEQIADGQIGDHEYSLIICSYAMHLADDSLLPGLCMQLAMISKQMIILSPHKRPVIKWGWNQVDEIIKDKTHARFYTSTYL
ncbi:unnamed protein product (macronuclear) [Paramecium tetraurelia]|uniref:Methyltransferase domain-containing protein n=1 Tax=Paramecium tetraurelia TaxID=5888 RepID=A0D3Y9_PARTE|nr:uncharacterized protein GSPATT00013221001 [Paramecium tetraurelia]CAK77756.1 unnamed protein product [Paramecium tetraurelia]|eukprot:XP_001445153.1 hypothetical protein (macronuclear) [Paramecium tetraurelia strain d4-2]